MSKPDRDFHKRLLATFRIEAEEHLRAISIGLIELERPAITEENRLNLVETVFREAHSLKGAARAVGMTEIETVCQAVESVFAALKRGDQTAVPELLDALHQTSDALHDYLAAPAPPTDAPKQAWAKEIIRRLEHAAETASTATSGLEWSQPNLPPVSDTRVAAEWKEATGKAQPDIAATPVPSGMAFHPGPQSPDASEPKSPFAAEKSFATGTVRIAAGKLDALLYQTEELLSAKLAAHQLAVETRRIHAQAAAWRREWGQSRADVRSAFQSRTRTSPADNRSNGNRKTDSRQNRLLELLEGNADRLQSLEGRLAVAMKSAEQNHRLLGGMVDRLLEDMKRVLMLPFSALFEIAPKFVRDLSHAQGKEVDLTIQGADIEMDRRILDEMKDPLIHLVRNCIDHGIEPSRERQRKPQRGAIAISVSQKDGGKVELLVSDDGTGIDAAKVRAAAVKLGVFDPNEAEKLTDAEVLALIFHSGLSTSPILTDISGRGLGLAIVREKVEKLGGSVSVETRPADGTTFRITLPLTLATFRGILARSEDRLFVFPAAVVERVLRVNGEEIVRVENRETLQINGSVVAMVRLADILELPRRKTTIASSARSQAIVLASAGKRLAFLVNEVLQEQDVLVKGLGKQLARVRNIAGATVLGDGKVVPILHVPDLFQSAIRAGAAPSKAAEAPAEAEEARKKTVLVVEDSITARTLVKGILETAGYQVETAVDGMDGLTRLKSGQFDLVVSDVDMPRMSGLDLTAKIRADKNLGELPVVLVTALESREDRERGIDVGANAYIVKSSFDQSNLLEAIRRLL